MANEFALQRLWAELGVEAPQQLAAKVRQGLSSSSPPNPASLSQSSHDSTTSPKEQLGFPIAAPATPLPSGSQGPRISLPTVRCKRLRIWIEEGQYRWTAWSTGSGPLAPLVPVKKEEQTDVVSSLSGLRSLQETSADLSILQPSNDELSAGAIFGGSISSPDLNGRPRSTGERAGSPTAPSAPVACLQEEVCTYWSLPAIV